MLQCRISGLAALAAVGLALLAPVAAHAAGKPVVTSGGAADIGQQSATLTGNVNPNGAPTNYYFQYGATAVYGATTTAAPTQGKMNVTAAVAGLAPATTYHYRLVAQNSHGLTAGADRTFKTLRQPLGVTL